MNQCLSLGAGHMARATALSGQSANVAVTKSLTPAERERVGGRMLSRKGTVQAKRYKRFEKETNIDH